SGHSSDADTYGDAGYRRPGARGETIDRDAEVGRALRVRDGERLEVGSHRWQRAGEGFCLWDRRRGSRTPAATRMDQEGDRAQRDRCESYGCAHRLFVLDSEGGGNAGR